MKKAALILIFCCASQPLQAMQWRNIAAYTTGIAAVSGCAVGAYYLWKKYNKPCQPVTVPSTMDVQQQIETYFNNFECLLKKSLEDLKHIPPINRMVTDLQKDDASEKILCAVLRYKKYPTEETLLSLAQKQPELFNPNHFVIKATFEKFYNYYGI